MHVKSFSKTETEVTSRRRAPTRRTLPAFNHFELKQINCLSHLKINVMRSNGIRHPEESGTAAAAAVSDVYVCVCVRGRDASLAGKSWENTLET